MRNLELNYFAFIFFLLFFIPDLRAQITVPFKKEVTKDSVQHRQAADTTKIPSLPSALDEEDSDPYIQIKRSVLDSLLNPFYSSYIDTIKNDILYKAKYRMNLKAISGDTIYVPMPREENYLAPQIKAHFNELKVKETVTAQDVGRLIKLNPPVWWKNEANFTLAANESAFMNWNAGGNNSVSGLAKLSVIRKYQRLFTLWNNEIFLTYGLNYNEEQKLRKTDDQILINSTFGYRKDTISNWYYTAKFNFKTQFTNGYKYPDTDNPISKFFAPAYLYFGAGSEYNLKKEKLSVYLSPLTFKSTFVLDDELSSTGAFGVEPGKNSRTELGFFTETSWEKKVMKNVVMTNRLGLYTDYLNDFGNIDVDWVLDFKLTVNKWIKANLGAQLVYDNDIKYKEDTNGDGTLETFGARVQLKQVFNMGFTYSF